MNLIHGDDATLSFADLSAAAGVDLQDFLADDVVTFTLEHPQGHALLMRKSSADGDVTYDVGTPDGAVTITHGDWERATQRDGRLRRHLYACPWALKRTRDGVELTVLDGTLDVTP